MPIGKSALHSLAKGKKNHILTFKGKIQTLTKYSYIQKTDLTNICSSGKTTDDIT